MIYAQSVDGVSLVKRVRARLARHWLTLVPLNWKELEPELLAAITTDLSSKCRLSERRPSAADIRDLQNFGDGYRGFQLMVPVLRDLSLAPGVAHWLRSRAEASLWYRSVLQGWSWPELQREGLCSGQRDGENRLRTLVRELLLNGPEL